MANQKLLLSRISIIGVLLLGWMSVATGQSADPKPKPNGSISGRVTLAGKAAAGIPVVAVSGDSVNRRDAAGRTVTDIEGRYQISGLAAGQYQVWTLTPGIIAEGGGFPYFPFYGSVKGILLAANEDVQNVDLKLVRGSVITGRITDSDNHPVVLERITVQMVDQNGASRLGPLGSSIDEMYQTDDRGIYRIFGLPAGRYKISTGSDPSQGMRRGQRYKRTFHPDTNDESKAAIVELKEADEATNIDIKVQTAASSYVVSGRVTDTETGVPIPKAGVRFSPVPKASERPAPGFGIQADDRGEFSFSGIAPGRYSVYATSEYYGGNFYGNPVYFEIVDKDVSGIEIKTVPGLSVSGVIVADGMSVKDLFAQLPGLRVEARGFTNDQVNSGGNSPVAPDGSFQVDGLRPGRVSISVVTSGAGIRPSIARIEHDGIGLSQGFDIQQSVSGLRILVSYGNGTIRGTVRVEGDEAIGDSRLYVNCKAEGARDGRNALVDARGRFLIQHLSPGTYEVTLQVEAAPTSNRARPIPPQKQTVSVANGSESEVTFIIDFTPKPGGP